MIDQNRRTQLIQELARKLASGDLTILIGAGVTKALTGKESPGWKELLQEAVKYCASRENDQSNKRWESWRLFRLRNGDLDDLIEIASTIEARLTDANGRRPDLNKLIEDLLSDCKPQNTDLSEPLIGIMALKTRPVLLTTNYDTALSQAMDLDSLSVHHKGDELRARSAINRVDEAVIHLHGLVGKPEGFVFGYQSYSKAAESKVLQLAIQSLSTKAVLCIGCGGTLRDPTFSRLTKWLKSMEFPVENTVFYLLATADEVGRPEQSEFVEVHQVCEDHDDIPAFLWELLAEVESEVNPNEPRSAVRRFDNHFDTNDFVKWQGDKRLDTVFRETFGHRLDALVAYLGKEPTGQRISLLVENSRPSFRAIWLRIAMALAFSPTHDVNSIATMASTVRYVGRCATQGELSSYLDHKSQSRTFHLFCDSVPVSNMECFAARGHTVFECTDQLPEPSNDFFENALRQQFDISPNPPPPLMLSSEIHMELRKRIMESPHSFRNYRGSVEQ